MNAGELYDTFRSNVVDTAKPYLWKDVEVYQYMDAAYKAFVRLTGGIADFTSDACAIDVVTGEPLVDLHPSVLRVMSATKRSDSQPLEIINSTDVGRMRSVDYGQIKRLVLDNKQGPIRYFLIGMQRGKARLIQSPLEPDTIDLHIYRLPLDSVIDDTHPLNEVDADHHIYLLDWMKHLAYNKHDADTYDPNKSEVSRVRFETYCAKMKAEWERYKHKSRSVVYGGL